ncbi:MAG TPA: ABC transporter permease subunit [Ktedonobacterales bacterium]|nr:ABC transporter permease subunit [Ktedonobacterales bacterium]
MIANTSERADALPTSSLDWLNETWRLARWQLFLARRRLMSKILLILLLVFYAIVVGFVALIYVTVANSSNAGEEAGTIRNLVAFPTSLSLAGIYTRIVGVLLLCVLVGALTGSEYGFGTLRLILPRGTSRGQLLVAQLVAVALLALAAAGFMLLVATLVGIVLGPILGATLLFPSVATWAEIVKFWLALSFHLFGYALIAYFAGTLGRSVLAGVALPLGYLFLEVFIGNVVVNVVALFLLGTPDAAERVRHIPDWFLGSNTSAIMTLVGQYPLNLDLGGTSFSLVRALAVALLYCVLLVGGSYLLLTRRDVTD